MVTSLLAGAGASRHPALAPAPGDTRTLPAFERTAAELESRIGFLLAAIGPTSAHP